MSFYAISFFHLSCTAPHKTNVQKHITLCNKLLNQYYHSTKKITMWMCENLSMKCLHSSNSGILFYMYDCMRLCPKSISINYQLTKTFQVPYNFCWTLLVTVQVSGIKYMYYKVICVECYNLLILSSKNMKNCCKIMIFVLSAKKNFCKDSQSALLCFRASSCTLHLNHSLYIYTP